MSYVVPAADVTVADFLRDWPEAARVFVRLGMACVGCDLSIFETLGEAAAAYEIQPERLLAELAVAIDAVGLQRGVS
jgi:hybrid cluster-associated redox disulfide protein